MHRRLPQYSGKDYVVLAIILLPITVLVNSFVFGSRYFTEGPVLVQATLITAALFALEFLMCGAIAAAMKKRWPRGTQTPRRLFYMILCFVALSGLFLMIVFNIYEGFAAFRYRFSLNGFVWSYVCMAIINIFLTLLIEGIHRYNHWRDNLKETEQIKKAVTQSQLLGLKSQVNPHFLFNSLNTLSSLIEENEKEAEDFLNEMTKVYRYMLRGGDEQLVPLHTELRFIDSYLHLLNRRFGSSLQVTLDIAEADKQKLVPHLSLQVIIENAFSQNSMSKAEPLFIKISSGKGNKLQVSNSRQPKMISNVIDFEAGLDNLVTKYRLLNSAEVLIRDEEKQRCIILPLIENTEAIYESYT
jgi:two-component system, LytTR family, sensor kinase